MNKEIKAKIIKNQNHHEFKIGEEVTLVDLGSHFKATNSKEESWFITSEEIEILNDEL